MTGVSQAKRGHTLQISRNFADLIVLRSAKEASGKAATSSRQNMKKSGFSSPRPAWALAYGFPRAPTTSPRAKAPRWREGSSKADRGQRLRGPWLRGPASHDANGIRRARRPGPIRRPLCCEQATDPARLWPQGRKREIYEQKIKIQRLKTSSNRRRGREDVNNIWVGR